MGVAARLVVAAARQRRRDGFAHDELLAEQAHGEIDTLADQRLAAPGQNPRQRPAEHAVALRGDQLAGQHQPPGRGIDEQRRTAAEVRLPVAMADFVANQAVDRGSIGNPQQRLGQAHQRHTFLARQRKLVHQVVDATRPAALAPYRCHQRARPFGHGRRVAAHRFQFRRQRRHAGGLVASIGPTDRFPQIHARLLTPVRRDGQGRWPAYPSPLPSPGSCAFRGCQGCQTGRHRGNCGRPPCPARVP